MAILLLLFFFAIVFLVIPLKFPKFLLRERFIFASISSLLYVVFLTEMVSLFHLLNFWSVLVGWLLGIGGILFVFRENLREIFNINKFNFSRKNVFNLQSAYIFVVLFLTFLTAIICPPNNWDSIMYHEARVAHWIQQGSIQHYATHIQFQLSLQPLAEFVILHLNLLAGSDRFANLVQWFSAGGSLVVISLIAKEFGANARIQFLAAFVGITIPMLILQSTSTQNDLFAAFVTLMSAWFFIKLLENNSIPFVLFTGFSFGLCALSKGTSWLFIFPFIVYSVVFQFKNKRTLKTFLPYIFIAFIALIINSGYFLRNIIVYKSIFGYADENGYINKVFTWKSLIANMYRNLVLHLYTPFSYLNTRLSVSRTRLMAMLGFSMWDARITSSVGWNVNTFSHSENYAQNFFTQMFFFASMLIYWIKKKLRNKKINTLLLLIFAQIALFCFIIKWQPFHSRLHLTFFLLIATFIAFVFGQLKLIFQKILVFFLITTSFSYAVFNQKRPIIDIASVFKYISWSFSPQMKQKVEKQMDSYKSIFRSSKDELFFVEQRDLQQHIYFLREYVKSNSVRSVGLVLQEMDWDFAFFNYLKPINENIEIKHVLVSNKSKRYEDFRFQPEIIVSLLKENSPVIFVHGNCYKQLKQLGPLFVIYKKESKYAR